MSKELCVYIGHILKTVYAAQIGLKDATNYCARLAGHQSGKTPIFVTSNVSKLGITMSPLELFPLTQGVFHINLALALKSCWQIHEILLFCRIASEEMNHFGGMKNICTSYPRKEAKLGCLRNSQKEKSYIFYNVYKARFYYFQVANSFLLDSKRCVEPI